MRARAYICMNICVSVPAYAYIYIYIYIYIHTHTHTSEGSFSICIRGYISRKKNIYVFWTRLLAFYLALKPIKKTIHPFTFSSLNMRE